MRGFVFFVILAVICIVAISSHHGQYRDVCGAGICSSAAKRGRSKIFLLYLRQHSLLHYFFTTYYMSSTYNLSFSFQDTVDLWVVGIYFTEFIYTKSILEFMGIYGKPAGDINRHKSNRYYCYLWGFMKSQRVI